jgi:hypothetical protein
MNTNRALLRVFQPNLDAPGYGPGAVRALYGEQPSNAGVPEAPAVRRVRVVEEADFTNLPASIGVGDDSIVLQGKSSPFSF